MTNIRALIERAREIHSDARAFNDYDYKDLEWMHDHYPTFLDALERVIAGLEFYATSNIYKQQLSKDWPDAIVLSEIERDKGHKARTVLKELVPD